MVEPHKPFLDSIPDHENLIKINKAMDNKIGTASYSKISDDKMFEDPDWEPYGVNLYRGMGTIYSGNVLHRAVEYKDSLETYEVPTTTFDEVMESLGIDTIDYLKIDKEGWDFQIFETIDFE
ncbi:FkbM family methyltransferase, partial [Chryseobacterium cucumeris]|uniref:FkbM family methyltransferase n=1 Tax=Chryseobacterium cucumeris TaxID=1813611 RepID=UPI0023F44E79